MATDKSRNYVLQPSGKIRVRIVSYETHERHKTELMARPQLADQKQADGPLIDGVQ